MVASHIFKDVFQYAISKVFPGITGLLMVVLFVRLVGVEEYGRFSLIFSFVITCATLTVGWLNQAQLRYYSKYAEDLINFENVVRTGMVLSILFCLLMILIYALGTSIFPNTSIPILSFFLSSVLALVFIVYTTRITTFQAHFHPHIVVRLELVRAILSLLMPLVLIWIIGPNHFALLFGLTLAYSIVLLQSGPWHRSVVKARTRLSEKLEKRSYLLYTFWTYGWPLSLWLGFMSMFRVTDRYLIQHFYTFEQTGVYASLYDLVIRSYSLLLFPITSAVHPRIMSAWNSGQQKQAISIIRWTLFAQSSLFILLVVACALTAPRIVGLVLSNSDVSASGLIIPLAVGGGLWQMALIVHKPLEMTENSRLMLLAIVGALGINVLINYWGLPRYGVIVAAYSTSVAACFYMLLCSIFYFFINRLQNTYSGRILHLERVSKIG